MCSVAARNRNDNNDNNDNDDDDGDKIHEIPPLATAFILFPGA